jgi:two-component system chemotaxis response regulator CheV
MNKSLISTIDEKSKIAGENRMQVLLFKLNSTSQVFGINVFKVREVMECPDINKVPGSHDYVKGIIHVRGESIPVIDLSQSIGFCESSDLVNCKLVLTEFNCTVQAFIVNSVERIENISCSDVSKPPAGIGSESFLTSIAKFKKDDFKSIVGIIDVEKVLLYINGEKKYNLLDKKINGHIMIIDDSVVARKQLKKILIKAGATVESFNNGMEGIEHLNALVDSDKKPFNIYDIIISDIEMPKIDGYHFARTLKSSPDLSKIPLILHTSLSGVFNQHLVLGVGADAFVSKFDPHTIIDKVNELLEKKINPTN